MWGKQYFVEGAEISAAISITTDFEAGDNKGQREKGNVLQVL